MGLVASNMTDGPIISGPVNGVTVNQAMKAAEANQPEGAQMELTIGNMGSLAQFIGSKINGRFLAGQITDPATGERIAAWARYPTQIAWGDDANGTLTLRWVKGQPWAVILVLAVLALAVAIYFDLRSAPWNLNANKPATSPSIGVDVLGWVVNNWPWVLLVGGAAVAVPWLFGRADVLEEDWRKLEARR